MKKTALNRAPSSLIFSEVDESQFSIEGHFSNNLSNGLYILYGHLLNVVTVVYFAVLILGGGVAIREAFRHFAG